MRRAGVRMYPYALFAHIVTVMVLFGVGMATDAALSMARRNPEAAPGLRKLVVRRLVVMETVSAVSALILGFVLILSNPSGPAIFQTGPWIHMKVTAGLLAILLVGGSRFGITEEKTERWVQPVRGIGMACVLLAVFAVKVVGGR